MQFDYNPLRVSDLLNDVAAGRLVLPEFQRDFVWRPKDIVDLLRTVARRWPAGSFLMMENAEENLPWRPIASAPQPAVGAAPQWLLLDGQQRMTALYQALTDNADESYYIDMRALAAGEFDDDLLRFQRKSKFVDQYPTIQRQAESGLAAIHVLADEERFADWAAHLSPESRTLMYAAKRDKLPGLSNYDIPTVKLSRRVPLAAVAKVFETLNRTGMRLGTFDLMIAKLYPHNFKLRDQWETALTDFPVLEEWGVGGIDALRVIALKEHLRQVFYNVAPQTVRGIRESDVLNLSPAVVIERWRDAVDGLNAAIQFARSIGAIHSFLIPSQTMLIPMAVALTTAAGRNPASQQQLRRWFWASSFVQTYSQGANTQAVADAKALSAWQLNPENPPELIREFAAQFQSSVFEEPRRRNEMVVLASACLLIKRNACDWITSERLLDSRERLHIHHTFAEQFLRNRGDASRAHVVGNLTPVLATTNVSLREAAPATVLARQDVSRTALETHAIDLPLFEAEDYGAYISARAARLSELAREAVETGQ